MKKINPELKTVFNKCGLLRKKAYAPYSDVQVSACLKFKNHKTIMEGVNVEYVVNGISVCAERSALSQAATKLGKKIKELEIEYLVVSSKVRPYLYPCGVCLQALSEFARKDFPIYVLYGKELVAQTSYYKLMPHRYHELPEVHEG